MQTRLASSTEYSITKPDTTIREIELLCKRAVEDEVMAICVPPLLVEKAKVFLGDASVKVSTVISYPYGYSVIEAKLAEVIMAMVDGVDELDVVINLTALKNNDWQYLATELNTLLPVIRKRNKIFTVVLESALLTEDDLIKCCDLYGIAGVDFLSLATGTAQAVEIDTIRLVRKHLAEAIGIKVSGKFHDAQQASAQMQAGASRIAQVI